MSTEVLETVVRKTFDYADESCSFVFQGGEPTLAGLGFYKDLIMYQKKYNLNAIAVNNAIQTNGFALEPEWLDFFAEHNFLVGISLDGIRHTHDAYRVDVQGNGSFYRILDTINGLKERNVDFNILTVVNRLVARRIDKIYEFYTKNQWRYLQFIACLDPLDARPGSQAYSLTPEAYGDFLIRLFELWYCDYQKGCHPYIRMFENYIGILMGYPPESCEQRGICGIQFVIEADGSVYPCDFYVTDRYRLGNFVTDEIKTMKNSAAAITFIEESQQNRDICSWCEYGYICRGGCRRNRLSGNDGQTGLNYFCPAYKKFFKQVLPQMRQISICPGRSLFLTDIASQEASDIHPM